MTTTADPRVCAHDDVVRLLMQPRAEQVGESTALERHCSVVNENGCSPIRHSHCFATAISIADCWQSKSVPAARPSPSQHEN